MEKSAPLVFKATVGAEKRLQSNGSMVAMVQGRTITLEFDQIDKTRITKVDKDGKVTVENIVESSQAKVGGMAIPDDGPSKDIDHVWEMIRSNIKLEEPKPVNKCLGCNHIEHSMTVDGK